MLWAHATESPVGRWTSLTEDRNGLRSTGRLNLKTTRGREAYEHLKAGDITGLSIGFQVAADGVRIEGRKRVLTAISLHEVSLVALPANQNARVTAVKSFGAKPATVRELEAALRDLGFTRREAATVAAKGFSNIPDDDLAEVQAALKGLAGSFIKV